MIQGIPIDWPPVDDRWSIDARRHFSAWVSMEMKISKLPFEVELIIWGFQKLSLHNLCWTIENQPTLPWLATKSIKTELESAP